MKTHEEAMEFLSETIEKISKPKIYDFSNSIIFTISNIDDVYVGSRQMDPDVDADVLHKYSKNIGLFEVKAALSNRFRPEQVARLGNNYVIYPSLSSEAYRGIISMELSKISDNVKKKFSVDINFDKSIHDILYREGVFPTQGARPIFTTINSAITSFIGRIMSYAEEKGVRSTLKEISWKFKRGKNIYHFKDEKGKECADPISFPLKIKVDNLRKATQDNNHAIVSVHESGHAIVAADLLGIVPNKIMSATAGPSEGFNQFIWDKVKDIDYLKSIVAVYIGGLEAERIIFGDDKATNGGKSDTAALTNLVLDMVNKSGLLKTAKLHSNPEPESESSIEDEKGETTIICNEIIEDAKKAANKSIRSNMKALMALSARLFEKTSLKKSEVTKILTENGVDIKKNNREDKDYYRNKLMEELSKFNIEFKILKKKRPQPIEIPIPSDDE
jgi:cell division protease FtsH